MITHILKGGEFYAESACKRGALDAERWNSSVERLQRLRSVGAITAIPTLITPVQVAARISIRPGVSFAPSNPHSALNILNMKILKLHST
jgi:hypothetical protein